MESINIIKEVFRKQNSSKFKIEKIEQSRHGYEYLKIRLCLNRFLYYNIFILTVSMSDTLYKIRPFNKIAT